MGHCPVCFPVLLYIPSPWSVVPSPWPATVVIRTCHMWTQEANSVSDNMSVDLDMRTTECTCGGVLW